MNASHEVNAYGDEDIEAYPVWTEVDPPTTASAMPKEHGLVDYAPPLDEGVEDLRPIPLVLDRESIGIHRSGALR
ncbi:hypothetical protein CQ039_01045 [Brevundimonas sp. MYb52]|nr:hypothetical protein CQ039_01045 [Brevundimonas sp. MYb52]PRB41983.1 hypothetical protein CQ028_15080 [Brevundimonas sp. MYb33]